ncbi:hypothetical protein LCGC14_2811510, partial [marine sediment metagenome]
MLKGLEGQNITMRAKTTNLAQGNGRDIGGVAIGFSRMNIAQMHFDYRQLN